MPHQNHHIQLITTILLLTSQLSSSATNKPNARPVYEVNEQARIDDKPKALNSPGIIPYSNPLAGNSKQNARIHASNQQAMFNAERIRQHKAQLQRWMKGPQIIDSYMKAYHELQENHQLELEEQQATLKDSPVTPAVTTRGRPIRQRGQNKRGQSADKSSAQTVQIEPSNSSNRVQNQRKDLPRRGSSIQRSEPTKITKADAVMKDIRSRNHRSYGSADYHQYLEPKRYKTIYVSPASSYSQGVNIKPHGNIGLNHLQTKEPTKLYTQAIPSEAPPTFPKQYGIQKFNSVQEIEALNSLLSKNPTEQLSELTALVGPEKSKDEINEEIPIDFYFYLKNPTQTNNLDPTKYASAYMPSIPIKDHTPITEEIDDIQDPTQDKRPITFSQAIPSTTATKLETVTTKNNYYEVEVASQIISDDTAASHVNYLKEGEEAYRALKYGYQPYYNKETDSTNERYLHHNAQPTGVQHLLEDGTETSAFGDDNVSIPLEIEPKTNKVRSKRSKLETDPFLLPNEKTSTEPMTANSTDTPTSEALIRLNPFNKKRGNDFNVFLAPDFPIGEAMDYNDDYDYEPVKLKKPSKKFESIYEEDDYSNYDDYSSPDYDFGASSYPTYASSAGYQLESKGSFSNKFRHFRRVPSLSSLSQIHSSPPATTYGVPFYGSPHIFSTPQTYLPPKTEFPTVSSLGNFQNIVEPVYMLTQSQLKELIGHHNLNIEHLDVYQLSKENKAKKMFHHPRKYRKRNPFRHVKKNLVKLHKFNL